jgi:Protein of unknown function (DUF3089)
MAYRGTSRGPAWRAAAVVVLAAMTAVACSSGDDGDDGAGADDGTASDAAATTDGTAATEAPLPDAYVEHESEVYGDDAHWLCRPGMVDDVCVAEDLDATAIDAEAAVEPVPFERAEDPPVDCFYVYPTVSQDPGLSADLEPAENQEVWVVRNQAARLTASCRVFAPVYRQATISAIGDDRPEAERRAAFEQAYADVVDAFRYYVPNESDGRGVVLVGHSQGAGILRRLVADEVDGEPALRARMVSALLIGTAVEVPAGEVVGGTFDEVPLCEASDQLACVVSYATFPADDPPGPDARFGRTDEEGLRVACVNPAAPEGGPATLSPYFPTAIPEGALAGAGATESVGRLADIETGWVTMPDYVEAECVERDGAGYLAATIGGGDDVRGTTVGGVLGPGWGLHLVDVNLAMGDLVDLVADQGRAYTG